ncbi:hypothetical protein C1I60_21535 [Paenibacillus terrae]|uniref:Uncharacterized protein n=1 Tax=Paenibacillus terrae TaxID=159743 RepID=A0A4U2PXA7_9BACL|nr:hypothetical protein [Paenibacillus terrae]TKH41894.1 hypothetical protein C1I60_21535 [Paenibacillus terrae]
MKKQIAALLMSTSLVLPIAAVASADSSSIESASTAVSSSNSDVQVINLGTTGNDAYLASNPPILTDNSKNSIITPMDTDGQNISYRFGNVSSQVWSSSPLPTHRSGKITLNVVQDTGSWGTPAVVNYQFLTKDFKKKSEVIQVNGNITGDATTITFYDVPQGTSSNPVYLFITNQTKLSISGNGYTK